MTTQVLTHATVSCGSLIDYVLTWSTSGYRGDGNHSNEQANTLIVSDLVRYYLL